MTALVLVGLAVVIALAVAWSRIGLARSERRSMKSYEHALHVLGDVAKRSDAAARIRPFSKDQASRGYIRTDRADEPEVAAPLPSSAPLVIPPEKPKLEEVPVRFEDDSDAFDRTREDPEAETMVSSAAPAPSRLDDEEEPEPAWRSPGARVQRSHSPVPWTRVSSVAAAVIIVTGLAVAGLELASGSSPRPAAASSRNHHPGNTAPTTTGPTSTTAPSALIPVSTSPTDVAFVAPSGTYTVSLADTGGVCWVGIERTAAGPYVWEQTLNAGQSATYRATGSLIIRIGAPRYLGVKVNGLPARLPGFVQPYNLTFNPASPPSSA